MSDYLKLSNGKEIYANGGVIGLSEQDHDNWSPSGGYDDGFPNATYDEHFDKDDLSYSHVTKKEMLEVCDIMIKRWNDFKKYVEAKKEKI